MKDGIFVNRSFNEIMDDYLNNDASKINTFNSIIVKILSVIYGDIDILNPYITKNAGSLFLNLSKYGYSKSSLNSFFDLIDKYYYLKNKNDLRNICFSLVDMIYLKNTCCFISETDFIDFWSEIDRLCFIENISLVEIKSYYSDKLILKSSDEEINNNKDNVIVFEKDNKKDKRIIFEMPSVLESSTGNVSILIILITIVIVSFGFAIVNYIVG